MAHLEIISPVNGIDVDCFKIEFNLSDPETRLTGIIRDSLPDFNVDDTVSPAIATLNPREFHYTLIDTSDTPSQSKQYDNSTIYGRRFSDPFNKTGKRSVTYFFDIPAGDFFEGNNLLEIYTKDKNGEELTLHSVEINNNSDEVIDETVTIPVEISDFVDTSISDAIKDKADRSELDAKADKTELAKKANITELTEAQVKNLKTVDELKDLRAFLKQVTTDPTKKISDSDFRHFFNLLKSYIVD